MLSKKKRSQLWVKEMKKKMYKKGNKSEKKNTWGKPQCFKEKDKKTKFSARSIVKK